ncbi:MAG TPA: DUF1254 domain-containing protein, partial [Polyangia bacterium]
MRPGKSLGLWLGCALAALIIPARCLPARAVETSRDDELRAIAEEAYVYAYPLVLVDETARGAPPNQFVRPMDGALPSVDTIDTSAFLDLTKEPIVLHVPDTHGRYYLLPMLDGYSNVFASPGKRTTGTQAHDFAIVGPGWSGALPPNVTRIDAPTNRVWIRGRTELDGKSDLPQALALTQKFTLTPLSAFARAATPAQGGAVATRVDKTPPPTQIVAALDEKAFFTRAAALLAAQPPPPRDAEALLRFAKIGLVPGQFAPSPDATLAIDGAAARARERMHNQLAGIGRNANGWRVATDVGDWGTRYLPRATVAMAGLGADLPGDAVSPSAQLDAGGAPLSGGTRYVVHFAKGQEPPANAFWTLTMYGSDGALVDNPIGRHALGARDALVRNAD